MKKLPRYINIANDRVRLKYVKNLPYQGTYSCSKQVIKISPLAKDIGGCLLHEIMEYLAACTYAVHFKGNSRQIEFFHSPMKHNDTWSMYIENLIDTIKRNKLAKIIFGGD